MKKVLESGPWLVQNVPVVLNVWEPGICGIGKIMSGVGKPLLMDNMTRERCLKNAGKMDFARVLVKVSAEDELPNILEIEYPPLGNRPDRVVRPRTKEEIVAKTLRDVLKVGNSNLNVKGKSVADDHGFTMVGRKNKHVASQKAMVRLGMVVITDGEAESNLMLSNGVQKSNNDAGSMKSGRKSNPASKSSFQEVKKKPIVENPALAATFNHNFRPKVLIRGSGSAKVMESSLNEDIPVKNSFNILNSNDVDGEDWGGINVNDEFNSKVWPKLKEEVDILMEAGIYPSKQVRLDWSIHQLDYFYKNCNKFHLDPIYEDDEEDVESEDEGIAGSMKPEAFASNVRGLNNTPNQDQVIQLLREDNFSLCGFLETHVKQKNLSRICNRVLGNWDWASNISSCTGGTRIIVGWDPSSVRVMVLEQSSQVLHCFVEPLNGDPTFFCSFVYAAIHIIDRRSFWKDLHKHKLSVKDKPWVILGDFNACFDPSERSSGCSKVTTAMNDFQDCVSDIKVKDIAISVFVIPEVKKSKPKPFKFHNYLSSKEDFIPTVNNVWSNKVEGVAMFSLVSKLKMLKKPLRKLNFVQGNLFENVKRLRADLALAQSSLCSDPHNDLLREMEAKTFNAYKYALRDEASFLKQKTKIQWQDEDLNGNAFHGNNVGEQFVLHFKNVLGSSSIVNPIDDLASLFSKVLSNSKAEYMIRSVSDDEIRKAHFDIDGNKAPRPDGYSAQFFNDSWNVVGSEVCIAVKEFFKNGKILKEINTTIISLVLKTVPNSFNHF
uniref:RNA-directed DNA polymerase, eukaryota, reverse transcriptase zinc-binding domain protein n=1 Tax=Tanacetum cinerariifolium TaxID=118510 RepID=A0A699IHW8_TANCI|nr:hypothetical protein [Tanacetum cinerariifolium]GEZ49250.1 hypothetical protein [Tanacetum cinerariifolium]